MNSWNPRRPYEEIIGEKSFSQWDREIQEAHSANTLLLISSLLSFIPFIFVRSGEGFLVMLGIVWILNASLIMWSGFVQTKFIEILRKQEEHHYLTYVALAIVFGGLFCYIYNWLHLDRVFSVLLSYRQNALTEAEAQARMSQLNKSVSMYAKQADIAQSEQTREKLDQEHTLINPENLSSMEKWLYDLDDFFMELKQPTRATNFRSGALRYGFINSQTPLDFVRSGYNQSISKEELTAFLGQDTSKWPEVFDRD